MNLSAPPGSSTSTADGQLIVATGDNLEVRRRPVEGLLVELKESRCVGEMVSVLDGRLQEHLLTGSSADDQVSWLGGRDDER